MVRRRQQNSSQKKPSVGAIRIISGLWGGRRLPVHDTEGLRPTTDRVKETLFNWLAFDIAHSKCLDVFSGSGGLGFEAASRQAAEVTLLEMDKTAFKQLQDNAIELKATNMNIVHTDALAYLRKPGTPYDLVFLDPPFHKGLLAQAVALLEENGWLADNAIIYIETEKELALEGIPSNWHVHREKKTGQVRYRLFERSVNEVPTDIS
ncbi:16S rRNA (guanine(966)-N(2))-methyltransferase RsmD [Vibrio sp. 10N.286.49.B3]|uniref:16S rRNA (guanine(966)-N(2))-methyltransferase RsmD n=1 Tax=Vibrio sp. 10N.286.49.B3 TaxID=1880855 RepID=UPI000C867AAC|nr:16S rRNA (guanine(966)-N(2))-methyltransferase RsmD [Vibrio sp. 10N.286.49.B3]PMH45478.1 16S rRNA (guanine(966)-N(2))-methyltransferase RsmD [Vibrio sp. 10N.286.49.B3]